MTFERNDRGDIAASPLLAFTAAPASGIAIVVRLEFARTPAQIERGGEVVQLYVTPKQARDLCEVLLRLADHVVSERAPRGTEG